MINRQYYSRQIDIIDPEKLSMPIGIVGAGAIGSWTALALLKLGCTNVTIIDFDQVGEENIGCQLYSSFDVGKNKVEALKDKLMVLSETAPDIEVKKIDGNFNVNNFRILISAVDNMDARKIIFERLKAATGTRPILGIGHILIDGRMAANNIQLYVTPFGESDKVKFYEDTLFDSSEALPIACSARAVVYNGFIIAGLIANTVAKLANGKILPKELIVDLENLTMFGGLDG